MLSSNSSTTQWLLWLVRASSHHKIVDSTTLNIKTMINCQINHYSRTRTLWGIRRDNSSKCHSNNNSCQLTSRNSNRWTNLFSKTTNSIKTMICYRNSQCSRPSKPYEISKDSRNRWPSRCMWIIKCSNLLIWESPWQCRTNQAWQCRISRVWQCRISQAWQCRISQAWQCQISHPSSIQRLTRSKWDDLIYHSQWFKTSSFQNNPCSLTRIVEDCNKILCGRLRCSVK
jgi:hypothetical protein